MTVYKAGLLKASVLYKIICAIIIVLAIVTILTLGLAFDALSFKSEVLYRIQALETQVSKGVLPRAEERILYLENRQSWDDNHHRKEHNHGPQEDLLEPTPSVPIDLDDE